MARHEDSSRERIVKAAIQLFAAKGFEGTSIRDITSDADCGVAAVNYHFGGKEKLYEEAFRALFTEVQQRRIEVIRTALENEPEMDLEGFLRIYSNAFLEPLMDKNLGALLITFIAREMSDRRMPPEIFVEEFIKPFLAVSQKALERFAPAMSASDQVMCLMSVVGQLIHILKVLNMKEHGDIALPVESADAYVEHIVRFSAAGIRACSAPDGEDSA